MSRLANQGACEGCGGAFDSGKMAAHLKACIPAHDLGGSPLSLLHLLVEDQWDPRYWLHIEARADATMRDLDQFLRKTWVECCGHMSGFRVGGAKAGFTAKLGAVLDGDGAAFQYEYDFGSTTALKGKRLGTREGTGSRSKLRLLARNNPLPWICTECPEPATVVCPICMEEGPAVFCARHAASHPCADEEVYLPVVNSPRMGVCGYTC